MWIMTSFGILMPATIPTDVRLTLDDPDWDLQVRARDRRALTHLRDEYMGADLGPIFATPEMDYDYRAYCDSTDFARAVKRMILEIDYEKFKPTTDRYGKMGEGLHDLYNRIWGVVYVHYEKNRKQRRRRARRK